MTSSARNFQEVSVRPTGNQQGRIVFPREPGSNYPPNEYRIRQWRCNLTALSHVANLFFLATTEKIQVFEPRFPKQDLGPRPSLVINLPKSGSNLRGHIDYAFPHSINFILVDFLGDQEVVLVACDDGDVVGYYTNEIQRTLAEIAKVEYPQGNMDFPQPQHFFLENVLESAWGISIHRQARMIAVSANSWHVTVFAFALSSASEPDDEGTQAWPIEDFPYPRARTHRFGLPRARNNIPTVSFCNHEPTGRWLVFADIAGYYYVCDVHNQSLVFRSKTRFCTADLSSPACSCTSDPYCHPHSVWSAFWIDRQAFRNGSTFQEAIGFERAELTTEDYSSHATSGIWMLDITAGQKEIRNSATRFGSPRPTDIELSALDPDSDQSDGEDAEGSQEAPGAFPRRARPRKKYIRSDKHPMSGAFPSPIMVVTATDVFLDQWASKYTDTNAIIGFHKPLKQSVAPALTLSYERFHTMNLTAQIPELGVVIIGAPFGRAVVLSLTQVNGFEPTAVGPGSDLLTFRADHILPFRSQEDEGLRPAIGLAGLAVSPVPGPEGLEACGIRRRWRLILTWINFTTLAYEISRPISEDQASVESLVV